MIYWILLRWNHLECYRSGFSSALCSIIVWVALLCSVLPIFSVLCIFSVLLVLLVLFFQFSLFSSSPFFQFSILSVLPVLRILLVLLCSDLLCNFPVQPTSPSPSMVYSPLLSFICTWSEMT